MLACESMTGQEMGFVNPCEPIIAQHGNKRGESAFSKALTAWGQGFYLRGIPGAWGRQKEVWLVENTCFLLSDAHAFPPASIMVLYGRLYPRHKQHQIL